ncbi:hypothetical protein [Thiohalorhabdus methylotrophus]|uniref:Superinfection immunity protein n=1 Tax=Thiohalorhabdus methylotrophus TaxID=3242694 RepID=A0ABV4TYQ1_9GAMM
MVDKDRALRSAGLVLVLLPAAVFHQVAGILRVAAEGYGPFFTDFWMTQTLLTIGAWVYAVPAAAAGLLWFKEMPGSGRSATPVVLFVYFLLSSGLWAIAALGTIEPVFNPEAAI